MEPLALVVFIVVVALVFDFINGFHDAANSIATVVSTRVLSPTQAVVWAAFFNFVAAFGFGVSVARTIGKGIVRPESVDALVILAALIGAIAWNLITWYGGIPSSSSHALIGGLAGAAVARAGVGSLVPAGLVKIAALHRPLAAPRARARLRADGRRALDLSPRLSRPGRPALPAAPARVGRLLQPGARHQRRAEDDGDHRGAPVRHRPPRAGVLRPAVGHPVGARGDRAGHARRRLADRQDHGHGDHAAASRSAASAPRPPGR